MSAARPPCDRQVRRRVIRTKNSLRLAVVGTSILAAWLAAAPASLASCVPPQLRPFADEPGSVVVAGTVLQVSQKQVAFDVELWWGDDPQPSVVIQRPPGDPTVITSVDWNPEPGEPWVILARRQGGVLTTNVCDQLPGTQATVQEVESSLGAGIVPVASDPPEASEVPDRGGDRGLAPIAAAIGLAAALAAGVTFVVVSRRRST
jgi:hypothetical protein